MLVRKLVILGLWDCLCKFYIASIEKLRGFKFQVKTQNSRFRNYMSKMDSRRGAMPNCPAGAIPNQRLPNLIPQYPVSPASRAKEASVMAAEAAVTAERIGQKIRIWFCLFWIGLMYWIGHTQNESDKSHESDPDTLILAICKNRALSLNRTVFLILAIGQKFQTWLSYFWIESGWFARIGHNFWIWLEQTCYIFPLRSGRKCQIQRKRFCQIRCRSPVQKTIETIGRQIQIQDWQHQTWCTSRRTWQSDNRAPDCPIH